MLCKYPACSGFRRGAIPSDPTASIFAAVRNLGLRIEPAKDSGDVLIIDHVERPSEN